MYKIVTNQEPKSPQKSLNKIIFYEIGNIETFSKSTNIE